METTDLFAVALRDLLVDGDYVTQAGAGAIWRRSEVRSDSAGKLHQDLAAGVRTA